LDTNKARRNRKMRSGVEKTGNVKQEREGMLIPEDLQKKGKKQREDIARSIRQRKGYKKRVQREKLKRTRRRSRILKRVATGQ